VDEGEEHEIELVEAGRDSAKAFESSEESFDFVAFLVQHPVVIPGVVAVALGWDDWGVAQVLCQVPGLIILVGAVHDQGTSSLGRHG